MPQVIATRRSTVAVVPKTQESALTKPTAGSQFVTIQSDFAITPNFETTENTEIKDDIMTGKTIITGEAPTGTFSHYFKGSGTAGKVTEYSPFVQSSFGGYRALANEQTLTAGSSTSVLKFSPASHGLIQKGDALLIKDAANGWEIRPVASVDEGNITLAYNLKKAPAGGTKLGVFYTYYPTSDNIPVYDLWHYIGGGESGVENIQNCRTTNMTISATAKDLINTSFTFEGTGYRFNEDFSSFFEIGSYNNQFGVRKTASGAFTTVTLASGNYTGAELAAEIQAKWRATSGYTGARVSYATDQFDFEYSSEYVLDFTPQQAAPDTKFTLAQTLGFPPTETTRSAGEKASTSDASLTRDYGHKLMEVYDQTDPVVARDQLIFVGEPTNNRCIEASSATFTIGTPKTLITSICTESGNYRTVINQRTATLTISAILEDDDRRFFSDFKQGDTTHFAFVGGKKEDGQWRAGESFAIYGSPASITSFSITNADNVYMLDLEFTCYSEGDERGSIFCSFV